MYTFSKAKNVMETEGMAAMLVRALKRMGYPVTYMIKPYHMLSQPAIDAAIDKNLSGNPMYVQINVWSYKGIDVKAPVTKEELEDWLKRRDGDAYMYTAEHINSWPVWFNAGHGAPIAGDGHAFTLDIVNSNVSKTRKQLPML
jgi:hypothetical protein